MFMRDSLQAPGQVARKRFNPLRHPGPVPGSTGRQQLSLNPLPPRLTHRGPRHEAEVTDEMGSHALSKAHRQNRQKPIAATGNILPLARRFPAIRAISAANPETGTPIARKAANKCAEDA
jgi:hypothetical protein